MNTYELDKVMTDIAISHLSDAAERTGKTLISVIIEGIVNHSNACGSMLYGLNTDFDGNCDGFFKYMFSKEIDYKFIRYEEYRNKYLVTCFDSDGDETYVLCDYVDSLDLMIPVMEFPCEDEAGEWLRDMFCDMKSVYADYHKRCHERYSGGSFNG